MAKKGLNMGVVVPRPGHWWAVVVIAAKLPSFWEGALPCPHFAFLFGPCPQPSFLPSLSTYLPSLLAFQKYT